MKKIFKAILAISIIGAMAPIMLMARIALKIFFITQNSFLIVFFDFGSRAYHTGSL